MRWIGAHATMTGSEWAALLLGVSFDACLHMVKRGGACNLASTLAADVFGCCRQDLASSPLMLDTPCIRDNDLVMTSDCIVELHKMPMSKLAESTLSLADMGGAALMSASGSCAMSKQHNS